MLTTQETKKAIYFCGNKRCREYQRQFTAEAPASYRQATGANIKCANCGETAWLKEFVKPGQPQ